jgi:pyruvate-ferredoxin/flavodoxin oxidoreductase
MLCSANVQEAQDLAAVAHFTSCGAAIPFLHFFDGFRTSHELNKIEPLSDEDLLSLLRPELVAAHRARALSPDHPQIRGTAQNPDTFFQAREAISPYYAALPGLLEEELARFGDRTGRRYGLVEYSGHPQAERVVILMGSGADCAAETAEYLAARGEKVGALKIRLFRPLPAAAVLAALPNTVKSIAVLDRTKEPGATGEPLYQEILALLVRAHMQGNLQFNLPKLVGGRYGLSSKEFTPGMVKGIFDELAKPAPKDGFTIGIVDDISRSSLDYDDQFDLEGDDVVRCLFYGLGADGTVGANKSSIQIIGEGTDHQVQAYFVYDSKKSGAITVSHLRFGKHRLRAPYLIQRASFVAVHQWQFLDRYDVLERAADGAVLLLNSIYKPEEVFQRLPEELQQGILQKKLKLWVIDAHQVAKNAGMGGRINTVMQTCFFAISGVLPKDEAIAQIKRSIEKSYKKRGETVVKMNHAAVDATLAHLHPVQLPSEVQPSHRRPPAVPPAAPDFVQRVTAVMIANQGDKLPVSAFPPDGAWPTGTARWEKRTIAQSIPVWDSKVCIQCNKCALVCPHAAIRAKVYPQDNLQSAPDGFKSVPFKGKEHQGWGYTIQVAPEDCTGCTLCVEVCPAKDKSNPRHKALEMAPLPELLEAERPRYDFFLDLPEVDRSKLEINLKSSQFLQPLFEYSGACSGCGETPYLKLLTQLYGDRLLIANATGCSSIYGGNLPTTPYTTNNDGRGPAWSNSLFEDNAEFGLGIRLAVDRLHARAHALVQALAPQLPGNLVEDLLSPWSEGEAGLATRRAQITALRSALVGRDDPASVELIGMSEHLAPRSVWIVGGDGWAYDIGYGGLDHVLASGKKVNILVLDTEVYSNTGGQQSKATSLGRSPSSPPKGRRAPKRTWACWPWPTATSTWPTWPLAPKISRQ